MMQYIRKLFGISANDVAWSATESAGYRRDRIFGAVCHVCGTRLDSKHAVAQLGACLFSGDPLHGGFLAEVRARDWRRVADPFLDISDQDVMACEAIRCPSGIGLIVWIELRNIWDVEQRVIFRDKLSNAEALELEAIAKPLWTEFP